MKLRHINLILVPITVGLSGLATYTAVKDAKNHKGVSNLKLEIAQKDPKRYDSLMHDGVSRLSYIDWQYEVNKMNDSLRMDSMMKRAYFEGAQMVRDSINKENK